MHPRRWTIRTLLTGLTARHGERALLDEPGPSVRAGDGELPYVLGAGASPRDTAISQVQTQQIRVSNLVERTSVAARTSSPMFRARSAPGASTPSPDGTEWDPDDQSDLAVDQALLGQLACPVHHCLRVHANIIRRTTDIFGYGPLTRENGAGSGIRTRIPSRADDFEPSTYTDSVIPAYLTTKLNISIALSRPTA